MASINITPTVSSSLLNHHHPTKTPPPQNPLQAAEDDAARFRHHVLIADLERLLRHGRGHLPPSSSDPWGPPGRRPLRVAYQGHRGSYSHEATARSFRPSLVQLDSFPCSTMEDAFSALEDRTADRAVVPAENSLDGPVHRNLDLLLRHPDVSIVGELVTPVNHCLLSLPHTTVSQLKRVVSHPQAISHCKNRLEALSLEVDEVESAAKAAEYVAENRIRDTAVIGSRVAAEEFGLEVLEGNFQNPTVNFNRFLQLGLRSGLDSGCGCLAGGTQKTTVAFSLENGVSDLFRAMCIFEGRGVRVIRVEQRPNRWNPIRVVERATETETGKVVYLDYVFVFDLEGSGSDPQVESGIAGLGEIAGFVRVLGSYTSRSEI